VSICLPVYNGEPYIINALNSAVNQSYKNLEIIIYDNCSTDKTAEIIKSFKIDGKELAKKSLLRDRNIYGEPSCVLFRKDKSMQAGYFEGDGPLCYTIDLDYWLRLSYTGNVYYINAFLSEWRVSSESATSNLYSKSFRLLFSDWNNLLKKHSEMNVIKLNKLDKFVSKVSLVIMLYLKIVFIIYNKLRTKIRKLSHK
jgi:GT2 family glycosyltransferase